MKPWVLLFFALCGCGANVVFGEDGGDGGNDGNDADGNDGNDADGNDADGSGANDGQGGASTSNAQGGASTESPIIPTIVDVKMFAGCKPEVGPDPLDGAILVNYFNPGSQPGALEVTSADISFVNPMEGFIFGFEVTPTSSGTVPPGATLQVEHTKTISPGDSSFVCSFCGTEGNVTFRWGDLIASAPATLTCAL